MRVVTSFAVSFAVSVSIAVSVEGPGHGHLAHYRAERQGNKDRVTLLPASLRTPLSRHLDAVRALHERDMLNGEGRVMVPEAIAKKYPSAPLDWRWQFVFQRRESAAIRVGDHQGVSIYMNRPCSAR